ncbi:MAG: hypothetical protein IPO49_09375 [Bacteroidetes bacterium]|nr:hypothetical protein [Bacteroidota bacterium]
MRGIRNILIFSLFFGAQSVFSQSVAKLTITDNLAASSKFGYGKPKPAAPKDIFTMLPEKGTQVLFYAELIPSDALPDEFRLKFTAYKENSGKEEWVDDRELKVKKTSTYSLAAINFFKEGNYKIVITNADDQTKILATGTFTINK